MMKLTHEYLKEHGACRDGVQWAQAAGLIGFPLDRRFEIQGDFKSYILWLKANPLHEHNEKGLVTKKIYPSRIFYEYEYNEHDLVTKETCSDGECTVYEYSDKGLMVKTINQDRMFSDHEYNENGHLIKTTKSSGSWCKFERDSSGLLIKTESSSGMCQDFVYNEMGLLTKNTHTGGYINENGVLIKNMFTSGCIDYYYNDMGLVVKEDRNGECFYECQYNELGLPTKTVIHHVLGSRRSHENEYEYEYEYGPDFHVKVLENGNEILLIPKF